MTCQDTKKDWFFFEERRRDLSSALSGKADLLVTGDKELLNLGKIEGMEIVSPMGFWKKMRTQPSHPHDKE